MLQMITSFYCDILFVTYFVTIRIPRYIGKSFGRGYNWREAILLIKIIIMIMIIIILMIYSQNKLIGCGEGFTYEASKNG